MLKAKSRNGFRILTSREEFSSKFDEIRRVLKERDGVILAEKTNGLRPRLVLKTELWGAPVVLKQEFFQFRFDRSLKTFLFGSDALNIFKISKRAHERGFRGIPTMFLAAERFSHGILRESISIFEFLDGNSLSPSLTKIEQKELEAFMLQCHENGIISGDICPDNFIATSGGLKLIDFRGNKIFPALSKAREWLQLERVFGLQNHPHGIAKKIFIFHNALRNLGKRLRGKATSPD